MKEVGEEEGQGVFWKSDGEEFDGVWVVTVFDSLQREF